MKYFLFKSLIGIYSLILFIVILFISIASIIILSINLIKPIKELKNKATEIANNNLSIDKVVPNGGLGSEKDTLAQVKMGTINNKKSSY